MTPAVNPEDKGGATTKGPSKNVAASDLDAKAQEVKDGIDKFDPDKGDKVVKKDQAAPAPAPESKKQERNTPPLAESLQAPGGAVADQLKSVAVAAPAPVKKENEEGAKPVEGSESEVKPNKDLPVSS